MQFPAFSGSELVNQEGIMLRKMKYYDLAIIIVSFQLFIFYSINKCKKISHFFHTSKINYYFVCEPQMLRVKQPDITMSGVQLETKPMSVHVLTVH